MATKSESKKSGKTTGRRIQNLPAKTLKAGHAKRIKGGKTIGNVKY